LAPINKKGSNSIYNALKDKGYLTLSGFFSTRLTLTWSADKCLFDLDIGVIEQSSDLDIEKRKKQQFEQVQLKTHYGSVQRIIQEVGKNSWYKNNNQHYSSSHIVVTGLITLRKRLNEYKHSPLEKFLEHEECINLSMEEDKEDEVPNSVTKNLRLKELFEELEKKDFSNAETIKRLVGEGANVNGRYENMFPLDKAVEKKKKKTAYQLLHLGAVECTVDTAKIIVQFINAYLEDMEGSFPENITQEQFNLFKEKHNLL